MSDSVVIPCPSCSTLNRVPRARLDDEPRCAECKAPFVSGPTPDLEPEPFARLVERSDLPVVVDFWAPWCGPCLMMAPFFEQARTDCADAAILVKVDTQKHPALGGRFAIQSIPTMVAFHKGRELARTSGAMQAQQIEQWVRAAVAEAAS